MLCTQNIWHVRKKLNTVQPVSCSIPQHKDTPESHAADGSTGIILKFSRARSRSGGPSHHVEMQKLQPGSICQRKLSLQPCAMPGLWRRGRTQPRGYLCASSPCCRVAPLKLGHGQLYTPCPKGGPMTSLQFGKLSQALANHVLFNRSSSHNRSITSCVCFVLKNSIIFHNSQRVRRGHTNCYRA